MAIRLFSQIVSGGNIAGATDKLLGVRSGTTDVLLTPVALDIAQAFTAVQTVKITDSATATVTNVVIVSHDSSGTPAASFGTGLKFQGQDSTTADQDMGTIQATWLVATHASRSSQVQIQTVSNAGALSTGLTVGSGINAATASLIVGGASSSAGALWSSAVTPSTTNFALQATSTATSLNVGSGGTLSLSVANSGIITVATTSIAFSQPITKISNISTAGIGVAAIYAATNITAQSSNATITSYTAPAADGDYEVSASVNVSAATGISTSVSVTYTDVGNSARTLILPVQQAGGTGGTYLTNGLIIAVGDYSTPVHKIRVKASTTITILTATGTFSGVTYSAAGNIKQCA